MKTENADKFEQLGRFLGSELREAIVSGDKERIKITIEKAAKVIREELHNDQMADALIRISNMILDNATIDQVQEVIESLKHSMIH